MGRGGVLLVRVIADDAVGSGEAEVVGEEGSPIDRRVDGLEDEVGRFLLVGWEERFRRGNGEEGEECEERNRPREGRRRCHVITRMPLSTLRTRGRRNDGETDRDRMRRWELRGEVF